MVCVRTGDQLHTLATESYTACDFEYLPSVEEGSLDAECLLFAGPRHVAAGGTGSGPVQRPATGPCCGGLQSAAPRHEHFSRVLAPMPPSPRAAASAGRPSPSDAAGARPARGGALRRPRRDATPRTPDAAASQRAVLGGRLDRSDVSERRTARKIAICVAWRWVGASLALLALGGPARAQVVA